MERRLNFEGLLFHLFLKVKQSNDKLENYYAHASLDCQEN